MTALVGVPSGSTAWAGLEGLLADPEVTEILLNGGGQAFVERRGRLHPVAVGLDEAGVRRVVERIIAPLGLRLDRSSPMVDARLPDGSRLHAVLPPVAVDGTCVAIRRFGAGRRELGDFSGGHPRPRARGGAGSRAAPLDGRRRLEPAPVRRHRRRQDDAAQRPGRRDRRPRSGSSRSRRPPSWPSAGPTSCGSRRGRPTPKGPAQSRFGRWSGRRSRLRPDRLIVGEVRGEEAFDLLQALNTGHCGSLCTIHANGPAEALARLESLVLLAGTGLPVGAIRAQIHSSVDAVVHVARRPDGRRAIETIAELAGPTGLRPLYPCGPDPAAPTRPARHPQSPTGLHVVAPSR